MSEGPIRAYDAGVEHVAPIPGSRSVNDVVTEMLGQWLAERQAEGLARYGTPLMTHNGRPANRDTLQELIDAMQYTVQAEMEREDLEMQLKDAQLRAERAEHLNAEQALSLGRFEVLLATVERDRDEARARIVKLEDILREAVRVADATRDIVKRYVDIDRDGDYCVPEIAWVTVARKVLGVACSVCGKPWPHEHERE